MNYPQLTHAEAKEVRMLQKRKVRQEHNQFLIEGQKIIEEAIAYSQPLEKVVITEKFLETHSDFLEKLQEESYPIFLATSEVMNRISSHSTPPEILAIVQKRLSKFEDIVDKSRMAAFIDISDPGNLGTMIRTADWFGFEGIILTAEGVDLYNEKVVRAAMGSLFHLPIYASHTIKKDLMTLRKKGISLVATTNNSDNDSEIIEPFCLLMGSESHGLSPEIVKLSEKAYTIPRSGQAESLNVAVSFGIIAHQLQIVDSNLKK